ncbi:protein of unknown function [Streptomyces murinus]
MSPGWPEPDGSGHPGGIFIRLPGPVYTTVRAGFSTPVAADMPEGREALRDALRAYPQPPSHSHPAPLQAVRYGLGPAERRLQLLEPPQETVDERGRLIGRELLRQLHHLVQHDGVRGLVHPDQLVRAQPQDVAVHDRHPVERPPDRVLGDQFVDAPGVLGVALDQLHRVLADRRLPGVGPGQPNPVGEDRQDIGAALVTLEENLEGALAGRVAGSHG